MATPISDCFSAGASFTPSPVIATQKFDDGSTNEGWIWAANAVPVAPATSGTDSNSKKDDSKTDSKSDSKTDSKANSINKR